MGSYSVAFTSAEKVWVLWKKGVGQHNETGEALGGSNIKAGMTRS